MSGQAAADAGMAAPAVLLPETALHVSMLSDWHVGSGARIPGRVDTAVRRDPEGLPYLPGTTLTGVLRDACLTVARALDDGAADGPWRAWHRYLFGEQATEPAARLARRLHPATIGFGPARISPGLRRRIAGDAALAAETTFVKPGVRIDPATGRAEDDMLRFVEMARAGLPLHADARIELPTGDDALEMRQAVTALLVLGAAWCDRIGGDRRRGSGRVALRWPGQDAALWARWLAQNDSAPPPPPEEEDAGRAAAPPEQRPSAAEPRAAPAAQAPMAGPAAAGAARSPGTLAVGLSITCLTPVRAPRQVVGNLVLGHDHLPGSALLAWLSSRWGSRLVLDAVAGGGLTVRHAYPEVAGRRGVPAPLSLFRVRRSGAVVNAAVSVLPDEPVRQVRNRWTLPEPVGGELILQEQPLAEATHNAVSRATQRPDSPASLYAVEVLPPGARLRATVLVDPGVAAALAAEFGARWWKQLAGRTRMGARRQGEYGLVDVAAEIGAQDAQAPAAPDLGQRFHVWAASDLVVRSRSLRLAADAEDVRAELTARLDGGGLRLDWSANGDLAASAARTRRRDSWQGQWQLPRDSIVGLAAGSVLAFRVADGAISPAAWADLPVNGLGERRAEGFGEVLLNAPLLSESGLRPSASLPAPSQGPPSQQDPAPTGEGRELDKAERDALALLRQRAVATACQDRVIALRRDASGPAGYADLRAALTRLSPSQRAGWLTLVNDAARRDTEGRLSAEIERWLRHQGSARQTQRNAAANVRALLDGGIDALIGQGPLDPPSRVEALAVLLDDLVDDLRRPLTPKEGDG